MNAGSTQASLDRSKQRLRKSESARANGVDEGRKKEGSPESRGRGCGRRGGGEGKCRRGWAAVAGGGCEEGASMAVDLCGGGGGGAWFLCVVRSESSLTLVLRASDYCTAIWSM